MYMYVNIQFMKTKVHMYMYFLEWSQKLCCTIWHISAEKAGSKLVKSSITPQGEDLGWGANINNLGTVKTNIMKMGSSISKEETEQELREEEQREIERIKKKERTKRNNNTRKRKIEEKKKFRRERETMKGRK